MGRRIRLFVLAAIVAGGIAAIPLTMATGDVPFKGADRGHFELGDACEGDGVEVLIEGTGQATHLGRYTYAAVECFHPQTGAFSGDPVFTAANGDTLIGHYTGMVSPTDDPDVITYDETLVVAGGTGRFAGMRGELQVRGVANLGTGEYRQQLSGRGLTEGPRP